MVRTAAATVERDTDGQPDGRADDRARRPHVLIAEDEEDLREVLVAILLEAGYEVTAVADLAGAHAELSRRQIDGLLLDFHLGAETTEPLLAGHTDTEQSARPWLLLVSASPHARQIAERYGVALLPKPFDLDHLLSALPGAADNESSAA